MLRYSRQTVLPQLGKEGQADLLKAKILLVGAGGLGIPCALALVAGGLRQLDLIDEDQISLSNLQRQSLYTEEDLGKLKVEIAARHLRKLNSTVEVRALPFRLDTKNILELIKDYDLIVDGSDNFTTKFLINDACLRLGKVWIYGSVSRFEGHLATFGLPGGSCYRCLFPQRPKSNIESCSEQGVLGSVSSALGALQALEAQKYLLGKDKFSYQALNSLKVFDLESNALSVLQIPLRTNCICQQPEKIEIKRQGGQVCSLAQRGAL